VKWLCSLTQIPELDWFTSVNALLNGWTNYFRYENLAPKRFGYLTGVVYWLTAHYLGRKHRRSIKRMMRTRYGRDPKSKRLALYTTNETGKRVFIWNKPPSWRSLLSPMVQAKDAQPLPMTSWSDGHSYEQREVARYQAEQRCEECGTTSTELVIHHPNRLAKVAKRKQGQAKVIASGQEQRVKVLCQDCHKRHHLGGWNGRNKQSKTGHS
jgi:Group II intron, maturase-specific domain